MACPVKHSSTLIIPFHRPQPKQTKQLPPGQIITPKAPINYPQFSKIEVQNKRQRTRREPALCFGTEAADGSPDLTHFFRRLCTKKCGGRGTHRPITNFSKKSQPDPRIGLAVSTMKRSAKVTAPLLASLALSMTTGCRKPEMQRCVDENNKVVDDSLCASQPQAGDQSATAPRRSRRFPPLHSALPLLLRRLGRLRPRQPRRRRKQHPR